MEERRRSSTSPSGSIRPGDVKAMERQQLAKATRLRDSEIRRAANNQAQKLNVLIREVDASVRATALCLRTEDGLSEPNPVVIFVACKA